MRVVDLFCGAGGFSEGFRNAGFEIIWAIDISPTAVKTHRANHPTCYTYQGDVVKLSMLPEKEFNDIIPDSEIIIGSPPCVAFSNSNKSGKADKSKGVSLVKAFLRIIARKKYKKDSILKYWIMENVPNIQNFVQDNYTAAELDCDGNFILTVKNDNSHVYYAEYFGVPSRRKRFICGEFPKPSYIIQCDQELIPLKKILDSLGNPNQNLDNIVNDPNYKNLSILSSNMTDHHYIHEIAKYQWRKAERLKKR